MPNPFFSLVTPTLQRESLIQCCQSVLSQSFSGWEMLIQIDRPAISEALFSRIPTNDKIAITCCETYHCDGGNTCRRLALERVTGEYIIFLDDDNILADNDVLRDMELAIKNAGNPAWCLFPITRLGGRFYEDPPRSCHVDTLNLVLRRDIAYWPDTNAYGSDGILVDDLMAREIPYIAFSHFRPIGIIPKISFCQ